MTFFYGNNAVMLPGTVAAHIDKATKRDLRVLFALAEEPTVRIDLTKGVEMIAKGLSLSVAEVENAIAFWRGAGVLSLEEDGESVEMKQEVPAAPKSPRLTRERGVASYTTDELANAIERISDFPALSVLVSRPSGKYSIRLRCRSL
jgi:hypothetical protein